MFGSLFCNVVQWHEAAMAGTEVMISAATVVQLRTMQMATGAMAPAEAARMIVEKPSAFASASENYLRALASNRGYAGGDPRRARALPKRHQRQRQTPLGSRRAGSLSHEFSGNFTLHVRPSLE